ncbi:MAG: hypothetical protein ABF876_14130 [Acetobacter aceti]|uniref:Uncharacterized protein n=1 Tax=Komagataeibacter intermedius NRIC 0521 TaxID=1307934 RepID=A0ABQ0PIZ5_9PROT|nr:hypothetical protein Gain_1039_001 [Komagataeibacter intermedius TF2]GBQ71472.1 hypothetical protein AA0521_1915 [Komagataeibacter intermedius NRIC 0521]
MIRQYYTSPFQGGNNPLRVGTIASGTIFRLPAPVSGRPIGPGRGSWNAF